MDEEGGGGGLTLDVDLTRTINFHGITYVVTTRVTRRDGDGEEILVVEAEQQHSEDRWTGQFSRQYVEEITHKTGNFKKFGVFVRMLLSALQQRSDSVFVDLLTYSDLELLKARKLGQTSMASAPPRSNNKRYLILTYAVEFDRVHYPLPLVYEDSPAPNVLKKTIRRLKEEIEALKQGASTATPTSQDNSLPSQGGGTSAVTARQQQRDLMLLQKENADLRDALRKQMDEMATEKDRTAHVALQRFKDDNEALRQELYQVEESLEELREQSAQEIRKLRREAKDLVQRLQDQQQQHQRELGAGSLGLNKRRGPSDREVSLRKQVADLEVALEQERMSMKRTQAKHRKEMSELVKQLDKEVAAGRILRSRNRDLQRKVAVLSASSISHNGNRSTASSRASSRPQAAGRTSTAPRSRPPSTYSSRANSTITSRCSSRANSTLPSRASSAVNSRNPSRVHSRDASPRFAHSHGSNTSQNSVPRGRMDTSKVYGAYDEHGVNVRRARGSNTSPAHRGPAAPRTSGPAPGSRYKSPYAQPVRNRSPRRNISPSAGGYQSGPSPDSSLARQRGVVRDRGSRPPHSNSPASARTEDRSSRASAPPLRRRPLRSGHSDDDRSPSPPPRPSHPTGNRSRFHDEDSVGALAPKPRAPHSGVKMAASSSMRVTVPTGQKAPPPPPTIATSNNQKGSKENQPPSVTDTDSRGGAAVPARAARPAWLDEDEPDSEEEEGRRPVQTQADVLQPHNAQPPPQALQRQEEEEDVCKPEPSGVGPSRSPRDEEGRGPEESGDFDASSEIGEIDRRLNALQTFLKQAKNGIITRIPVTPRV